MNKCKSSSPAPSRFLSSCLAVLAACVLLAPAAYATPYVVTLQQQGNNVVAIGEGKIDTTNGSLQFGSRCAAEIYPLYAVIYTGATESCDAYEFVGGGEPVTGPYTFGNGGATFGRSGTGDLVALVRYNGAIDLYLPSGYASDTSLSSSATWNNATFASLGVTPGSYVWTWGNGAEQSFTLDIVSPTAVPEPAALGMFGFGVLLIGVFVGLRRRTA